MNSKLFFSVLFVSLAAINSETIYDVTKYGADNKGSKKSTDAIKKAIEEASAKGGGTVFFPDGDYLTDPLVLKSHITFHLADKALIKFNPVEGVNGLIYAKGATNIAFKGKGTVDGDGSYWWNKFKQNSKFVRPTFLHFDDCKGITIEDITIKNSPMMNIKPNNCEDLTITGVKIENPENSPNTDGINMNSVKNVVISKVTISTGDDCIALNSGKTTSMNVHISDCHMIKGHGGVSIGSPTTGGLKNITVTNCVFESVVRGLYIKTNRERGGLIEDIHYSGITMNGVQAQGICLNMNYVAKGQDAALLASNNLKKEPVTSTTPHFRNIEYKDIKGSAKWAVFFVGLPESLIENIKLTNIAIKAPNANTFINTKDITIDGKKQ